MKKRRVSSKRLTIIVVSFLVVALGFGGSVLTHKKSVSYKADTNSDLAEGSSDSTSAQPQPDQTNNDKI